MCTGEEKLMAMRAESNNVYNFAQAFMEGFSGTP